MTPRLRVMLVTGAYHPQISSSASQCRAVARVLADRIEFSVLTTATELSLPVHEDIDGVPVYRVLVRADRPGGLGTQGGRRNCGCGLVGNQKRRRKLRGRSWRFNKYRSGVSFAQDRRGNQDDRLRFGRRSLLDYLNDWLNNSPGMSLMAESRVNFGSDGGLGD